MKRVCLVGVVLAVLAGCRNASAPNEEVVGALEVLKSGLEAWKNGSPPAALLAAATPLEFTDSDWQGGAKLLEYRIVKVEGEEDGATLCLVSLNLDVGGRAVARSVSYRVLLTPRRTVARYLPS